MRRGCYNQSVGIVNVQERVGKSHSFILREGKPQLKTTELVESLVLDTVRSLGFELCDVEFAKEFGNWVLTLFINKEGGVTIDDCELVSKAVDPVLDAADPIEQAYYLSVSSLGLDRPIKKDADFARNLGGEVEVKLYAPREGKKELMGLLQAFDSDAFTLAVDGATVTLARKDAALIKPVVHF